MNKRVAFKSIEGVGQVAVVDGWACCPVCGYPDDVSISDDWIQDNDLWESLHGFLGSDCAGAIADEEDDVYLCESCRVWFAPMNEHPDYRYDDAGRLVFSYVPVGTISKVEVSDE